MRLRTIGLLSLLASLSGCGDFSQTQGTLLGAELPGLGDLDNITKEEKAEASWWDKFYGKAGSASDDTDSGKMGGTTITPMADPTASSLAD